MHDTFHNDRLQLPHHLDPCQVGSGVPKKEQVSHIKSTYLPTYVISIRFKVSQITSHRLSSLQLWALPATAERKRLQDDLDHSDGLLKLHNLPDPERPSQHLRLRRTPGTNIIKYFST